MFSGLVYSRMSMVNNRIQYLYINHSLSYKPLHHTKHQVVDVSSIKLVRLSSYSAPRGAEVRSINLECLRHFPQQCETRMKALQRARFSATRTCLRQLHKLIYCVTLVVFNTKPVALWSGWVPPKFKYKALLFLLRVALLYCTDF